MSMWRCPHCGTPQAETARCWVCHRSSTTCSTCRNFNRSVAGQVGFCGLDRRRLPLSGTEHRGCWEARAVGMQAAPAEPVPQASRPPRRDDHDRLARTFIPVELLTAHPVTRATLEPLTGAPASVSRTPAEDDPHEGAPRFDWQERRTLFGEVDR